MTALSDARVCPTELRSSSASSRKRAGWHANSGDVTAFAFPPFALSAGNGEAFIRPLYQGQHGALNWHPALHTTLGAMDEESPRKRSRRCRRRASHVSFANCSESTRHEARSEDVPSCRIPRRGHELSAGYCQILNPSTGRAVMREAGVFLFYLVLAIVLTWPLTRSISTFVSDLGDPLLNAWILDWDCYALTHAPLHLYDAPIYAPGNIRSPTARTSSAWPC